MVVNLSRVTSVDDILSLVASGDIPALDQDSLTVRQPPHPLDPSLPQLPSHLFPSFLFQAPLFPSPKSGAVSSSVRVSPIASAPAPALLETASSAGASAETSGGASGSMVQPDTEVAVTMPSDGDSSGVTVGGSSQSV